MFVLTVKGGRVTPLVALLSAHHHGCDNRATGNGPDGSLCISVFLLCPLPPPSPHPHTRDTLTLHTTLHTVLRTPTHTHTHTHTRHSLTALRPRPGRGAPAAASGGSRAGPTTRRRVEHDLDLRRSHVQDRDRGGRPASCGRRVADEPKFHTQAWEGGRGGQSGAER